MSSSTSSFDPNVRLSKYAPVVLVVAGAVVLSVVLHARLLAYVGRDTGRLIASRTGFSADTTVLAVGGSHMQCAINPELFDFGVANLSHSSNDYSIVEQTVKQYLDRASLVNRVIIEIDPVMLSMDTLDSTAGGDALYELGISDESITHSWIAWTRRKMSRLPLVSRPKVTPLDMLRLASTAMRWDRRSHLVGCVSSDSAVLPGRSLTQSARQRAQYHASLWEKYAAVRRRNHEALLRTIRLLAEHDVEIVLMLTPRHQAYIASQHTGGARWSDEAIADIQEICDVQVWDFRDPSWTRWEDRYLRDADHISNEGARILADKIRDLGRRPPDVSGLGADSEVGHESS